MDKKELVALTSFSYNTRRLSAGDVFIPKSKRDETLLLAIKKAKFYNRELVNLEKPDKNVQQKVEILETVTSFEENIQEDFGDDVGKEIITDIADEKEITEVKRRGRKPYITK